MAKAVVDGREYDIPDIWITGFCHRGRRTVEDAIQFWHEMVLLEEQYQAEKKFNCHCIDCCIEH